MYKNIYLNLEELEDSTKPVQFAMDTIELDSGVNMDIKGVYTPGSYTRDPIVNLKLAYRGTVKTLAFQLASSHTIYLHVEGGYLGRVFVCDNDVDSGSNVYYPKY
jgi:hypothetical protein